AEYFRHPRIVWGIVLGRLWNHLAAIGDEEVLGFVQVRWWKRSQAPGARPRLSRGRPALDRHGFARRDTLHPNPIRRLRSRLEAKKGGGESPSGRLEFHDVDLVSSPGFGVGVAKNPARIQNRARFNRAGRTGGHVPRG
ncbi:MAG: hypothetical protein WBQ65_02355, partial [Bryobacteraceae bacterium]